MNIILKICRFLILVAAILILLNLDAIGQSGDTLKSQAKINYLSGNGFIQHAVGLNLESACVNMPLMEGDRVGTTDGRMEIDLGNGNYIRLDKNTKIDFNRLPRSASRFTQVRLWSGSAIISLASLMREKNLELNTPDVTVYLLDQGVYRLDVDKNKETRIYVSRGLLEAAGESESILLKKGQRASAVQGRPFHTDIFASTIHDPFFNWNKSREEKVGKIESSKISSRKQFTSIRAQERLLLPTRINRRNLNRIQPPSPVNRLYKYLSKNKRPIQGKNITGAGAEKSVSSPQKIRPPTKKESKKKK